MDKEGRVPPVYRCGTLQYTLRGLMVLFVWLLGGDFAFTFFEQIFGRFVPLYLKDLQASNSLIGIMTGSIAGAVNLMFLPGISRWSDECRSRWGRRIPFLAVAAPITVVSLILVGFAPEIGTWLHSRVIAHIAPAVSLTAVILTVLCGFVVSFHYFNMLLCNGFGWLVRDVVPYEWISRFLSWFRIIGTVSGIAFSWYVFPYVIIYRKAVCVGVGLFYLVTFMLMCWNVKEGEYPPPPVREHKPGILKAYAAYFRTCFSIPIYRNGLLCSLIGGFSGCAGPFFLLFYRDTLHIDMGDLGKIFAIGSGVAAVAYLPMGWICHRCNPFRVVITAGVGNLAVTVLSFFFLNNKEMLLVFTVIGSLFGVAGALGGAVMGIAVLPTAKFGQLTAAGNVVGCGIGILGNYLVGVFMDLMHSNYRMAYVWSALSGLTLIPLILVYRGWKAHGGPDNYVAPLPPD